MKKQGKFFVIPLGPLGEMLIDPLSFGVTAIIFAILGLALLVKSIVFPSVAYAGPAVCPSPRESVLPPYFCENDHVNGLIAQGNADAEWVMSALRALRDGGDPEFYIPTLADALAQSGLTLSYFLTNEEEIARATDHYYSDNPWLAAKMRGLLRCLFGKNSPGIPSCEDSFKESLHEEFAPPAPPSAKPTPARAKGERFA